MENLTDRQKTHSKEPSGLTPYHIQRNLVVIAAVEEMSKRPYSYEEKLAQTARNKAIREDNIEKAWEIENQFPLLTKFIIPLNPRAKIFFRLRSYSCHVISYDCIEN